VIASLLFSAFSVGPITDINAHGRFQFRSTDTPPMDTDRLLKIAQEYFEHEYASYFGGTSLLAGAVVWFYATDISRAFKVNSLSQLIDKLSF